MLRQNIGTKINSTTKINKSVAEPNFHTKTVRPSF